MTLIEIVLIAVGLAMDASAVSLVAAASGFTPDLRSTLRLAFHFGLFQGVMPVLGWALGSSVVEYIQHFDHWIAFFLLLFVGGRMLLSVRDSSETKMVQDPTRGFTLVTLSVATSIDALAVGLSLSFLGASIWIPCLMIAVITAGLSIVAAQIGKRAPDGLGKHIEALGGLILIGIGSRILFVHLFSGSL